MGVVAPARIAGTRRTRAATRSLLLVAGLGAALGLRVALGGTDAAASMPAGFVFGVSLLTVAIGGGWRAGRPTVRGAALGAAGGAVIIAAWLTARPGFGIDIASPNAAIALWTPVVATVALVEEVLLRGVLFDAVRDWRGDGAALIATTLLFALLHLPLYGAGALPLDLAVGLLLGGLRIVSGGVLAPAVAHVIADLAGGWLL